MCKRTALPVTALAVLLLAGAAAAGEPELRDPTRPSYLPAENTKTPATRAPAWEVESIIVSAGRRLAVVNGRVVGVNDRVGGARILEITPYEVRLEYQGEIRHISLVPTRVKRTANER